MKNILSLLLGFSLLLSVFSPAFALENEAVEEADIQGTSEEVLEVNSFELFWPVVAGKTRGDSLYGLKRLKEKLRGWFIFGKAQKADYHVFLATKRVVEAEKLVNEGKKELAIKTLDNAIVLLESAKTEVADSSKGSSSDTEDNINKQLENIEIFIPVLLSKLVTQDDNLAGRLKEVLNAVKAF